MNRFKAPHKDKLEQLMSLSLSVSIAASRIYRGRLLLNKQEQEALFQMEEQLKQEAEMLINPDAKLRNARLPISYILDLIVAKPDERLSKEDAAATLGALVMELHDIQYDRDPIIAKAMADQYRALSVYARGKLAEPGEKLVTEETENQLSFDE